MKIMRNFGSEVAKNPPLKFVRDYGLMCRELDRYSIIVFGHTVAVWVSLSQCYSNITLALLGFETFGSTISFTLTKFTWSPAIIFGIISCWALIVI